MEERSKKETTRTDTHGSGEKVGIGGWELRIYLIKNQKNDEERISFRNSD